MNSEAKERHKRATAAVFGVLLTGLGVLFLLQNFGYINAGQVGDWWPLLLIGFGIASLIAPKDPGDSATGVAVAALGAFFLLRIARLSTHPAKHNHVRGFGRDGHFLRHSGIRSSGTCET